MKSLSLDLALATEIADSPGTGASERLWGLRARGTSAVAFAAVLTGADGSFVADAAVLSLAASEQAGALLESMNLLARTLTSTIDTTSERCVHSVRGPIQWAETITARANALGNDDVYVCLTSERSIDTVENRVLGASLRSLVRAGRLLESEAASDIGERETSLIEQRSAAARRWLEVSRLGSIASKRLTAKDLASFRRSRRLSRMHSVAAFLEREKCGLENSQVASLCDPWTRKYHHFVAVIIDAVGGFDSVPEQFGCTDGSISGGPIAFRHPAAQGTSVPGLTFRGIPLLPPEHLLEGAPWAGDLPVRGFRISSETDLRRLMKHLGLEEGRSGRV